MAIENVVSLIDFEKRRKIAGYLPTDGEVVRIGRAKMTFHQVTTNEGEDTGRIDINLDNDVVRIGDEGKFALGHVAGRESIYRNMTIGPNATLKNAGTILDVADGSICDVQGKLDLSQGVVNIYGGGILKASAGADRGIINFGDGLVIWTHNIINAPIIIESAAIVHASLIDYVMHNNAEDDQVVQINKSATIKIDDPSQSRPVTVNDVIFDLHNTSLFTAALSDPKLDHVINGNQRIGFQRYAFNDEGHLALLRLRKGEFISGDLPLKIFKSNVHRFCNDRVVNTIVVEEDAKLTIDDNIKGNHYYEPSVVIGEHSENYVDDWNTIGGELIIKGSCYCNEGITIADGTLNIANGGHLVLGPNGYINFIDNNAKMIVDIGSCLTMLNIDQIKCADGVTPDVTTHEMGKVIITNKDAEPGTVLLDIPAVPRDAENDPEDKTAGILLYQIFGPVLDKVEFHIPTSCCVRINEKQGRLPFIKEWYNGDTILKAIYYGWIVWHDDAIIQAKMDYEDPNKEPPVYESIISMFKTRAHTTQEKFQEVADAFRHAGAGNVMFKFDTIHGQVSFQIVTNVPTIEAQEYAIAADEYFVKSKIPKGSEAALLLNNNVENVDNIDSFKDPKKNVEMDKDTKEARFKLDGNQD